MHQVRTLFSSDFALSFVNNGYLLFLVCMSICGSQVGTEFGARKSISRDTGALSIGPKSAASWNCGHPILLEQIGRLLTGLERVFFETRSWVCSLMERDTGLE
jgi:hypothetical protein